MSIVAFSNKAQTVFNTDALVPDVYAAYRPLIRDGVEYFLAHLPQERLAELLEILTALPEDTPVQEQAVLLMRECPTLHKLGQVLARHQQLDPAFREHLRQLESCAPTTEAAELEPAIRKDLGEAFERFDIRLGEEALAEASVAVVLPCTWKPSTRSKRRKAVLKVLRPGIAAKLHEELKILRLVTDFLDQRREVYKLAGFEFRQTLDSVRDLLAHEVVLEHEQNHLREAFERFENEPDVLVPAVLPFCTPRTTAMEFVDGISLSEYVATKDKPIPTDKLGNLIARVMLARTVFSRESAALFHADPHAGNLMVTRDGRLAILDWSLVGRLHKSAGESIIRLFLGAIALDTKRMYRALSDFTDVPEDDERVQEALREALRRIRRGRLPGLGWLTELFEDLAKAGVRMPQDLLLFQKSLFTLRGVIAEIDPRSSIDRVFIEVGAARLLREWPRRFIATPISRNFSTHASNIDLLRIYLSTPNTVRRFWRQSFRDVLDALRTQ